MPGMNVKSSKHEDSSHLNTVLLKTGLRGMLEGKEYRQLDIVSPIVFGYAYISMDFENNALLTKIHVQYTELGNRLVSDN